MRFLVTNSGICTGCQKCVLWCSLRKARVQNPARSRIHVIRSEPYVDEPIVCTQCGLCIPSCPPNAITQSTKTGAVVIDEEKCNGCSQCIPVCPYGVITIDPESEKALKCDLCGGNPVCIQACPVGALSFVDVKDLPYQRRVAEAAIRGRSVGVKR